MAIAYGNVYVAQVTMGANSGQTLVVMQRRRPTADRL